MTTGNEEFLQHAAEVVFGDNAEVLKSERVSFIAHLIVSFGL